MALPGSRRPKELEDELDGSFGSCNGPKISLKLRVNKLKIFFDTVGSWYVNKRDKDREKLRKKDVLFKAKQVTKSIRMEYSRLPPTWLKTLHSDYGVNFKWRHPEERAKLVAIKRIKDAGMKGELAWDEMKRKVKEVKLGILSPAEAIRQFGQSAKVNKNGRQNEMEEDKTDDKDDYGLKSKFVDLSQAPAPSFWVEAYAQGKHLPRVLKTVCLRDTGQTLIYYDYAPRIQYRDGSTTPGVSLVHNGNNFMSWNW